MIKNLPMIEISKKAERIKCPHCKESFRFHSDGEGTQRLFYTSSKDLIEDQVRKCWRCKIDLTDTTATRSDDTCDDCADHCETKWDHE